MGSPKIIDKPPNRNVRRDGPETSLRFPHSARSLAVVAPHPDDETLAAGGLIFDLVQAGWDVSIVVVTDGAASHPNVKDLAEVRADECRKASQTLGLHRPPIFLGFADGQVSANLGRVAGALQRALIDTDVVVAPRANDYHSDHCATAGALDIAFDRSGPARLHYAIWGWDYLSADELSIGTGTTFHPSPDALAAKRSALQHYQSQISDVCGRVIIDDTVIGRHSSEREVFWW